MSVTHTTSARLQTCSPFVTFALSSPTEPSGVHYSRTIGEVSILFADAGSTFGNREENEEKLYWYSSMGGCVLFELCSVIEGLQVGVKANERNVVKQVIVCRILKNKEATLTGASSCISMWLVLVRKETRRSFGFVGRGLKSGTVSVALFF